MIVLYNPRSSSGRKPIVPYALLALAAVLEAAGDRDWQLVDGNLVDPLCAIDAALRRGGVKILAVTVMPGPQLQEALPVTRAIRRLHPDVVVVWGGYFPSQHHRTVLASPWIDYVVRRHGEQAFLSLVTALRAGRSTLIPGVVGPDGDGGDAPTPHPRELPVFPFERIDLAPYVRSTFLGRRTLGYHSSYGCPFTCNFCAVVNMVEGRWYPQTAQQVSERIGYLVSHYSIDAVEFYDNNFFTSEKRAVAVAEALAPQGLQWWGEGRVDTLLRYSDESLHTLSRSGLKMVFLGAESGSAETLERMNKGGTLAPEMTLALCRKLRRFGVLPELSFVVGNPPDPAADIAHTLGFIRQVKAIHPGAEVILYLYTPVPLEGELLDEARKAGFRYPDRLEDWADGTWLARAQRRSELPWLSRRLREHLRGFERVLNAYHPTSTDPRLGPVSKAVLRGLSAWRYHTGIYALPLELQLAQRVMRYQRPETSGF